MGQPFCEICSAISSVLIPEIGLRGGRCIDLGSVPMQRPNAYVLDYFGGSRHDGPCCNQTQPRGRRDATVYSVEDGDLLRYGASAATQEIIFTPEWKDGKPKRLATDEEAERGPRIFKIVRLESYEDTLNNLEVKRTRPQQSLLDDRRGTGRRQAQGAISPALHARRWRRAAASRCSTCRHLPTPRPTTQGQAPGSDESREVNVDLMETFNWLLGLTVQHIAAPRVFSAAV